MKIYIAALIVALFASISIVAPVSAGDCALGDMTVTATFPNDPGYEGLYKYTITGSWDTGQKKAGGLSHISFAYQFECPCMCDESELSDTFAIFPEPAGTATGSHEADENGCEVGNDCGSCEAQFTGTKQCKLDKTLSAPYSTIKFDVVEINGCETANTGTGTWCFYSSFPPVDGTVFEDAVYIKYGTQECTADLVGQFPSCWSCIPVPTESTTWGEIKKSFD